mgnify:CR=1 FL=1
MSHFYSVIQGNRGQATRCGTKDSGIRATAASWTGAIRTDLWYDEKDDVNRYTILMIPWHGVGATRIIKSGRVGAYGDEW